VFPARKMTELGLSSSGLIECSHCLKIQKQQIRLSFNQKFSWWCNMYMDQRTATVHSLLADYVRSPSLRHIREPRSLAKLALEIVTKLDHDSAVWRKWQGTGSVHGRGVISAPSTV
jgi:hypothetical protein